jgi:hypothetical protein
LVLVVAKDCLAIYVKEITSLLSTNEETRTPQVANQVEFVEVKVPHFHQPGNVWARAARNLDKDEKVTVGDFQSVTLVRWMNDEDANADPTAHSS